MGVKRTTFTELVVKSLMLFSIFTLIQTIDFFDSINKLWMVAVFFALAGRLMTSSYTVVQLGMLIMTVIIHLVALLFTSFPLESVNILVYFAFWVVLYVFFSKNKNKILSILQNSQQYICVILWVWTVLIGITALVPASYVDKYFNPFGTGSFRLLPSVLIIMALSMYMANSQRDKRYELFLILPTYAAFMNQSRTYFGIYVLLLLMYLYMRFKSSSTFYIMLIPVMVIIIVLMLHSGIMDKILSTQYSSTSYFDFWGTVTSGRTVFWRWDLEAFFALPFWQQFLGNGFNFVYDVNGANMARIWAHNDIINLLMNFGYIGVVIYLWAYFQMVKVFWPKGNKIPFVVKVLFHGAVFINSMMNMSYTYLCAMISYPLFLCAIDAKYGDNLSVQKSAKALPRYH